MNHREAHTKSRTTHERAERSSRQDSFRNCAEGETAARRRIVGKESRHVPGGGIDFGERKELLRHERCQVREIQPRR